MRVAAFFDMDGTLVRCNTGTLFIRFLRRRGEITVPRMLRAFGWIAQYKLAVLDMERLSTRLIAEMAGDSEAEMADKCRLFFEDEIAAMVTDGARSAIARHRESGHVLAILTSSTRYLSEKLAERVGIEHVLCTRLDIDAAGRFAGTHVRPACYGPGKVHWAERFAHEHDVDLRESFFYTDSYSDLPMLERVGSARVINPDARLLRHARRVGWEVTRW
jgi:HAD superfamily hydrolase (TIGR01490 family)